MPLAKPIDLLEVVTRVINSGDIDAQMGIYEPDAYFNFEPSGRGPVTGIQAIREAFTNFLAMKPNITMRLLSCNEGGNIAVIRNAWHLTCTGQDGNPMEMTGQTVAVLRRQPDGNWLVLVDNPYGLD
jgi:ketosteroid isomerase-like protein